MSEIEVIPASPDRVTAEPEAERAATRAVLLRFEDGRHTASDTLTILQAIGLVDEPQEQENRLPSAATVARRRRRVAARERAREERAS